MPERWVGAVVVGDAITLVEAEVPADGAITILADESWPLQKGDRPVAYAAAYQRISDYVTDNKISKAIVKESAVSLGGTKKAHLLSAEFRGVVLAALASKIPTETHAKASLSKTFGERKVDDYLSDSKFWEQECKGKLRAGSREAALMILASRD
ncbi:hypothetical protein [Enterovirga aerilata]|uniref:Uncharacterized protein n=1 Tax=Enterovirga aerilata TaxID=2730920 RepID=A0A849I6B5_9HYPH|nr:hypothetical protein [Enterovirga sp. DB1703]NNM75022.1 hypothetical protein [Enterovirga sp. DB1703]